MYGRAEGIADHYWPWRVLVYSYCGRLSRCSFYDGSAVALGRDRSELFLSLSRSHFSASGVFASMFLHFGALFLDDFRYHVKSVRASCFSLPLPPSLSFLPALPSLTPPLPHLTLPYSPLFTAALCVVYATFYCSFHVGRSLFMTNPVPISFISVPILSEFYKSGAFSILPYV